MNKTQLESVKVFELNTREDVRRLLESFQLKKGLIDCILPAIKTILAVKDNSRPGEFIYFQTPDDVNYYRVAEQFKRLHYIDSPDDDNPQVQCPACKFTGLLMDDFSYLEAGFNGIEADSIDDLDCQECGHCSAKLEW